jgi:23S rRNA pseudouridine1911/1915/1917 synthase
MSSALPNVMNTAPVSIRVETEGVKERLDIFLARFFPDISRAKIQKSITFGAVQVNGAVATKKTPVVRGDFILFDMHMVFDKHPQHCVAENIPLSILYEDEFCIAVNKPAGMVVHPGNANKDGTLVHALLYYAAGSLSKGSAPDRPGIVHRLDKGTSGVILVAKNEGMHQSLSRLFAERQIHKQYIGICCGRRPPDHDVIGERLGRSRRDPVKRSVREDGKEAITEYRLVAHHCGISVVRFFPHTGRTHQIRVHASSSGFPVVCDPLYGGGSNAIDCMPVLDRPFAHAVFKCFSRHALHAWSIAFEHPVTKKQMTICAPLPDDFLQAMSLFTGEEKGALQKMAVDISC